MDANGVWGVVVGVVTVKRMVVVGVGGVVTVVVAVVVG